MTGVFWDFRFGTTNPDWYGAGKKSLVAFLDESRNLLAGIYIVEEDGGYTVARYTVRRPETSQPVATFPTLKIAKAAAELLA